MRDAIKTNRLLFDSLFIYGLEFAYNYKDTTGGFTLGLFLSIFF
jgi:hypothetical protein